MDTVSFLKSGGGFLVIVIAIASAVFGFCTYWLHLSQTESALSTIIVFIIMILISHELQLREKMDKPKEVKK